jgi:hypothetical protein
MFDPKEPVTEATEQQATENAEATQQTQEGETASEEA